MRIAKEATVGSMKKLVRELSKVASTGAVTIQVLCRSYSVSNNYQLYFPGVATFNWKYFDTWEELVQFCFQLIAEKEGEKKHQSGLQPK